VVEPKPARSSQAALSRRASKCNPPHGLGDTTVTPRPSTAPVNTARTPCLWQWQSQPLVVDCRARMKPRARECRPTRRQGSEGDVGGVLPARTDRRPGHPACKAPRLAPRSPRARLRHKTTVGLLAPRGLDSLREDKGLSPAFAAATDAMTSAIFGRSACWKRSSMRCARNGHGPVLLVFARRIHRFV
jgi:hypothetical protein